MPTRAQACAWIAAAGLLAPSMAAGQDRTEREIVEQIRQSVVFATVIVALVFLPLFVLSSV